MPTLYIENEPSAVHASMTVPVNKEKGMVKAMKRREARELLFTLLYETQFYEAEGADEIYRTALRYRDIEDDEYVRRAFYGIEEYYADINAEIAEQAKGWNLDRLSRITGAILRLCVYELMFEPDIPAKVSINEAVELAKKYDTEKSYGFVNGVLNAVADKLGKKE